MRTIRTFRLEFCRESLSWNVSIWESDDAGESFHFTGVERNFKADEDEEYRAFCNTNRSPLRVFPFISSDTQNRFERTFTGYSEVPCICGYFGRACRQMNKDEGANRALCHGCPLAEFAAKEEMRAYALS